MKASLCWILLALSVEGSQTLKHESYTHENHRTSGNQSLNSGRSLQIENLFNQFSGHLSQRLETLEMRCCNCSMNGGLQSIMQNQELIMDGLKQLTKLVELNAKAVEVKTRKITNEVVQATERIEAGYQKIELGLIKQLTKLKNCPATSTDPLLQEIDNNPGKKEWKIKQKPIVEDNDY